jgi:hypothetical protein
MKKLSIKLIEFYQRRIAIFLKPSCVFYPSCSEYAKEAIKKYDVIKGVRLAFFRILRCHPWQKSHFDPVL